MSRSRKKPIIKDGPRNDKKSAEYWRTIRRVTKDKVRNINEMIEDESIPDPKSIVNDYNYSDYRFDMRYPTAYHRTHDDESWKEEAKKAGRK